MESGQEANKLSFEEKACIFSHEYLKCCMYLVEVEPSRYTYTKRLYSQLVSTSQLLEDLLDFHGAKNNRKWYFYRELSAAVRHLSNAAYSQKHIFSRLPFYELREVNDFEEEGEATHQFIILSLRKLAPIILEEAGRLEITLPDHTYSIKEFPRVSTSQILESDIDDEERIQKKENVVKVSSEFLNIAKVFDGLGFYERLDKERIRQMVPAKVNEVEIRRFEMVVHNLQSAFDSYVIHGGYRLGNRKLKQLRGYFSVVLHLLSLTGRLLHFYERHLHDVGYKNVYKNIRDRLASLIDPESLLDRTINYGLYFVCFFLTQGRSLAKEILNENITRKAIRVGIPMNLGFHSRPSLLVAKIVQHFGGQVEMVVGEHRFDASSVLDIQWAGGKIHKENIKEVVFEGDERALKDIAVLASVNYGEDTMGKGVPLPKELGYLK